MDRFESQWRTLTQALRKAGWQVDGEPATAQYDAPWVPGPMRRNEILVAVRREP